MSNLSVGKSGSGAEYVIFGVCFVLIVFLLVFTVVQSLFGTIAAVIAFSAVALVALVVKLPWKNIS